MKNYKFQLALYLILLLTISQAWGQFTIGNNYNSYKPKPGEKYIVSGWVQENHAAMPVNYMSNISVSYSDANDSILATDVFTPSGAIIDGWQRIIGEFTIPTEAVSIEISLSNQLSLDHSGSTSVYFDDIRVHPFNGNLKSFVYDPATQRLLAELDENNYATYYDYDREGGLVRVKKETEKGVYTIQETRSSTSKNNND